MKDRKDFLEKEDKDNCLWKGPGTQRTSESPVKLAGVGRVRWQAGRLQRWGKAYFREVVRQRAAPKAGIKAMVIKVFSASLSNGLEGPFIVGGQCLLVSTTDSSKGPGAVGILPRPWL